jgi:hypothetical protein
MRERLTFAPICQLFLEVGSANHPRTGQNYILRAKYWYEVRPWLSPGF